MPRMLRGGALMTAVLAAAWMGCGSGPGGGNQNQSDGGAQTAVLTVVTAGNGTGVVSGNGIDCGFTCTVTLPVGTSVTLTAAPTTGSSLGSWSGCDSSSGNTCTLSLGASRTVTATFSSSVNHSFDLKVTKSGTGSGTVTGSGINCGTTCDTFLPANTQVTLTATPDSGSVFAGWSSPACPSSGNTCSFILSSALTVQANFNTSSGTSYTLTVAKAGSGSGTVTGNGISCGSTCSVSLASGTPVTLTASAASGSTFASWAGCDSTSGATCNLTLGSNRTVTATFSPAASNYTLTVAKAGSGSGTVTGNGISCGNTCTASLGSGTAVSLTASAASGSTFASWAGCDSTSGTTCNLTLSSNRTVTATFNTAMSTVSLKPTYNNGGVFSTVNSNLDNTVYANQADLIIGCAWTYYTVPYVYYDAVCGLGLMIFDLSSLSGHTIVSAQLQLTVQYIDGGLYQPSWDLYASADPWSPSTVTWNVAIGLRYFNASLLTLSPPTGGGVASIDVTTSVTEWVAGAWPNYGFVLVPTSILGMGATSDDRFGFYGLYGPAADVPELVVQYQ